MGAHRKILHLDLDAFFCAVEEQRDASLKGKAFAVGGRPEDRGVVASCSYPARKFGVRSAMPMARALRLCPGLILVRPRHDAYERASVQVMERSDAVTPLVERVSIDEAFLDVTHNSEPAEAIARQLQRRINQDLGLPCSLGVATNKLVAKIANDVGKASAHTGGPPNAVLVVPPGQEAAFLAPLPVVSLWGVGAKTAESLESLGIRTIGDLALWPEADLARRFGQHGRYLAQYAHGIDDSPVETVREAKSISKETTFPKDIRDRNVLEGTLLHLSEGVGRELRQAGLTCGTVGIKYRRPDFTTLTRQISLRQPTDLDHTIYTAAKRLLRQVCHPGDAVRLLGVAASKLSADGAQLSLWAKESEREKRVQDAVDALRDRFGEQTVRWGKEAQRGKE